MKASIHSPPSLSKYIQYVTDHYRLGIVDILRSFRHTNLWAILGYYDFILRYRRAFVGPFWETLTIAIWVLGLGVVFSSVLRQRDESYLAFLAVGFVLWTYMSSMVASSTTVFTSKSDLILSVNNPLYTYALRHIVVHIAKFVFHLPVPATALLIAAPSWGWNTLMAAPGILSILLASLWVAPLLGFLGARYRDLTYLINVAMRLLFFMTPVFWRAEDLAGRTFLTQINPFAHFLEVARAPLIGESASGAAWLLVLLINAVGLTTTLLLYGRFRRQLVFWF